MELWVVAVGATTTTITTTTRATTTTVVQATTTLGAGTGDGGQAVWDRLFGSTELWAALLGALVGGVASAVGSYILHRVQSKKDIRIRMYDDLIPDFWSAYLPFEVAMSAIRKGSSRGFPNPRPELLIRAGELRRAGAIVGGNEAHIAWQIWRLIRSHTRYDAESGEPVWKDRQQELLLAMDRELDRLVFMLSKHLERKLTRALLGSWATRRTIHTSGARE